MHPCVKLLIVGEIAVPVLIYVYKMSPTSKIPDHVRVVLVLPRAQYLVNMSKFNSHFF